MKHDEEHSRPKLDQTSAMIATARERARLIAWLSARAARMDAAATVAFKAVNHATFTFYDWRAQALHEAAEALRLGDSENGRMKATGDNCQGRGSR